MRCTGHAFGIYVVVIGLLAGCGEPPKSLEAKHMNDPQKVFEIVDRLLSDRPFTPAKVSHLVGVELRRAPDSSNNYFSIYQSARGVGLVSEVELRLPTEASTSVDGLIVLSLSSDVRITERDVMDRFGDEPTLAPPSADEPPGSPVYFEYSLPSGTLRFGFQKAMLTVVVIDAIGAAQ